MSPGLCLLILNTALARDYYVGSNDGDDEYVVLEDAVAAALVSREDDVLYVDSGYQMDELVLMIDGNSGLSGKLTIAPQPPETGLYLPAVMVSNGAEVHIWGTTFTTSTLAEVPSVLLGLDFLDVEPLCGVCITDSTVLLEDVAFADYLAMAVLSMNSSLTLQKATIENHALPGVVVWSNSRDTGAHPLEILDGTFAYNHATAVRVRGEGQSVLVNGTTFRYNEGSGGSDLEFFDRAVTLNNVKFVHSHSTGYSSQRLVGGAPISGRISSMEGTLLAFDHTRGTDANGIYLYVEGQTVDLDGVTFMPDPGAYGRVFKVWANEGGSGGLFYLRNLDYQFNGVSLPLIFTAHDLSSAFFTDSKLDLNGTEADGALVDLERTPSYLERLILCNGTAGQYQYPLFLAQAGELVISRSIFQNISLGASLVRDYNSANSFYFLNNTFVDMDIPSGLVGIDSNSSTLYFVNNSVVNNTVGLMLSETFAGGWLTHNHWEANGGDVVGGGSIWDQAYDQKGDPLFTGYDPGVCGSLPIPWYGSKLIDAGYYDAGNLDDDGTVADIGAMPNTGQGYPADDSGVDDSGPTESGGQEEEDLDADGIPASEDCNDQDPKLGGPEIFNDNLDQDCDGLDATSSLVGAVCSCSAGAAGPGGLLLFGLLALRRRKD